MLARSDSPSLTTSAAEIAPSGGELPAIDRAVMLAAVEQDLRLLEEIIELFLAESPGLMLQIRAGVTERNAELVERCSHTLKGALSNFGARRACDAARELENRGREARLDGAGGPVSALESEVVLACKALSDYLREVKGEHSPR